MARHGAQDLLLRTYPPSTSSTEIDPGAFSDDEFEETTSSLSSPQSETSTLTVARTGKGLNPGALSFVPGKAVHQA